VEFIQAPFNCGDDLSSKRGVNRLRQRSDPKVSQQFGDVSHFNLHQLGIEPMNHAVTTP